MDWDFDWGDSFDSLGTQFSDILPSDAYTGVTNLADSVGSSINWGDNFDYSSLLGAGNTYNPSFEALVYPSSGGALVTSPDDYYSSTGSFTTPTVSTTVAPSAYLNQADEVMQKVGKYLETPGGKLGISLGGGVLSAMDAMKKQALMKKAQKAYEAQLAARQAKAQAYDAPLRLAFERTKNMSPSAGANGSEAQFFSNNKLPSYYAEGGGVSEPSAVGFIKYLIAGRKLPQEVREAEEAKRRALRQGDSGTMMEGAAKLGNRRQQLEEMEKAQGFCKGGALGYVRGGTAGQADKVPAMLSDGEYVWDADVVSALGDGNNEAGAKKLDEAREAIRAHKRSAPANKIPPKAKAPLSYIKKEKK